jgi:hypothetical protein
MEREAEKAALPAAPHERSDVEEGGRPHAVALERDDLSVLQRQEDARVSCVGDRRGLREPRREGLESDIRRRLASSARRDRRQSEPE